MQVLQLGLKFLIGKCKYGCMYCNEAPKFQLVNVSMDAGIVIKSQNSNW
jgi:hypothetical protein